MSDTEPDPIDPLARILQLIDARMDERFDAHLHLLVDTTASAIQRELEVTMHPTLELFATAIAELQAGEGGAAYRAWVVEEARRLQVRPGEVAGSKLPNRK